jgi:hypothetical protein
VQSLVERGDFRSGDVGDDVDVDVVDLFDLAANESPRALAGVSCSLPGSCVAVDATGNAILGKASG